MVDGNLYIRRAVAGDAALVSALSRKTFFESFHGTCTDEDIRGFIETCCNPVQIHNELQDPGDFYFVAFINEKAAGYIRMKEEESEVVEIKRHRAIELKRIYVLKEYHSKQIGAKLMTFALDFAAEKNYELVWLGVWEHNEKAKAFYAKFGFEDTGCMHPFSIGNTQQRDNWLIKFIEKKPL